jgi:UDP-N-acetylglucosamine 2-epimerase (non-hydrolysing)
MKIIVVAGARPNFMKVAPLINALKASTESRSDLEYMLLHTGQHYDQEMSRAVFQDLGLPRPDVDLQVGSGTHAEQTGKVMIAFERLLMEKPADWVVVVGDVNSTLACTLAAVKLGIKVAHVEAGLRSHDRTMPEEINRLVTDALADLLFVTDPIAAKNLEAEGVNAQKIHFVGNVMIDTLLRHRERASGLHECAKLGLQPKRYAVLTLHRPSNVDQVDALTRIIVALEKISAELPIVFPVHPRARKMAERFGLWGRLANVPRIRLREPLGYLEMLSLNNDARLILTDSGGLQEEAVVLGVPCITLRENTERPITIEVGANRLVGNDTDAILKAFSDCLANATGSIRRPDKWDGLAARRIVDILLQQS